VGCNCGGKTQTRQVTRWEFTSPTGTVRVYNSEIEAQAAKVRAKGGSVKAIPAPA
jgi:hypothetical protein